MLVFVFSNDLVNAGQVMKKIFKENSHKYTATLLQIAGVSCFSGVGTIIFKSCMGQSIENVSFGLTALFTITGMLFFLVGWYIMYRVDRRKSKRERSTHGSC